MSLPTSQVRTLFPGGTHPSSLTHTLHRGLQQPRSCTLKGDVGHQDPWGRTATPPGPRKAGWGRPSSWVEPPVCSRLGCCSPWWVPVSRWPKSRDTKAQSDRACPLHLSRVAVLCRTWARHWRHRVEVPFAPTFLATSSSSTGHGLQTVARMIRSRVT